MALRGIKPEIIKVSKPKFMLSGKPGTGKTMFALNFPAPFLIDAEGGATRPQYRKKMNEVGAMYFGKDQGSQSFDTVLDEVKELATAKHDRKTVIIDSYSKLYNVAAADAELRGGSEFGRDKKEANKPSRQLLRWTDRMDLTCILICHTKDKWKRDGKEVVNDGTTFDGFDKFEYDLDLWLEVQLLGRERFYTVKKTRIDAFPLGAQFPLDYGDFSKRYGQEIVEGESKPIVMATEDQVLKITHLLSVLKIEDDQIKKWLAKDEADSWAEMSTENAAKVVTFLEKKIKGDTKETV